MAETERDGFKLLPCPFCGGEPSMTSGGPGNHYVRCMVCHVTSDDTFRDDAAKLWNRRAERSTLLTLVQEMGKALEDLLGAYSEPDRRLCCDGRDCGCMGSTVHQQAEHYANTALASFAAFMEGQDNG